MTAVNMTHGPLSSLQTKLLCALQAKVPYRGERTFRYVSEWLGYLPFGTYQWIEHDGDDISESLPDGWCLQDLDALAANGDLALDDDWQDPADEFGRRRTYRVVS